MNDHDKASELVERIDRRIAKQERERGDYVYKGCADPELKEARALIERQSQAAEALVEALEPFAKAASEWDGEPPALNVEFCAYDGPRMNPSALVADFRGARRVVRTYQEQINGNR